MTRIAHVDQTRDANWELVLIAVSTSYQAYTVDALALLTDEGRGDRRNVQGELHTSEEP